MNWVAWLGVILLSCASVPQVLQVMRQGHGDGMSWSWLVLLYAGFICMLSYTLQQADGLVLSVSYVIQLVLFTLIIFRKRFPRATGA